MPSQTQNDIGKLNEFDMKSKKEGSIADDEKLSDKDAAARAAKALYPPHLEVEKAISVAAKAAYEAELASTQAAKKVSEAAAAEVEAAQLSDAISKADNNDRGSLSVSFEGLSKIVAQLASEALKAREEAEKKKELSETAAAHANFLKSREVDASSEGGKSEEIPSTANVIVVTSDTSADKVSDNIPPVVDKKAKAEEAVRIATRKAIEAEAAQEEADRLAKEADIALKETCRKREEARVQEEKGKKEAIESASILHSERVSRDIESDKVNACWRRAKDEADRAVKEAENKKDEAESASLELADLKTDVQSMEEEMGKTSELVPIDEMKKKRDLGQLEKKKKKLEEISEKTRLLIEETKQLSIKADEIMSLEKCMRIKAKKATEDKEDAEETERSAMSWFPQNLDLERIVSQAGRICHEAERAAYEAKFKSREAKEAKDKAEMLKDELNGIIKNLPEKTQTPPLSVKVTVSPKIDGKIAREISEEKEKGSSLLCNFIKCSSRSRAHVNLMEEDEKKGLK